MPINANITNKQTISLEMVNNQQLYIISGTANFSFHSPDQNPRNEVMRCTVHNIEDEQFLRATATGSISEISTQVPQDYITWSVNNVDADWDDDSGDIILEADLNIRGTGAQMRRMGFQVIILTQKPDNN